MEVISSQQMESMVPEWCFDGNLVYYRPELGYCNQLEGGLLDQVPCIIVAYYIMDLKYDDQFQDDEWLYIAALVNGTIVEDVHSAFQQLK